MSSRSHHHKKKRHNSSDEGQPCAHVTGECDPRNYKGKKCEGMEYINILTGERWIYKRHHWVKEPCTGVTGTHVWVCSSIRRLEPPAAVVISGSTVTMVISPDTLVVCL